MKLEFSANLYESDVTFVSIRLVGRVPSKKNNRLLVNGISLPSKDYTEWKNTSCDLIVGALGGRALYLEGGALSVTCYFGDMTRTDLSNKLDSIQDMLIECGVLNEDQWSSLGDIQIKAVYLKGQWGCDIQLSGT